MAGYLRQPWTCRSCSPGASWYRSQLRQKHWFFSRQLPTQGTKCILRTAVQVSATASQSLQLKPELCSQSFPWRIPDSRHFITVFRKSCFPFFATFRRSFALQIFFRCYVSMVLGILTMWHWWFENRYLGLSKACKSQQISVCTSRGGRESHGLRASYFYEFLCIWCTYASLICIGISIYCNMILSWQRIPTRFQNVSPVFRRQ